MNLEEYQQRYTLYKEFSEVVLDVIKQAAKSNKTSLYRTSARAKKYSSLCTKIMNPKYGDKSKYNIENFITDLAGCRLIFYYKSDIDDFIQSSLL
jgi:ppGpp synthetase/RelA/SpoT-type nucleotidyltranferase